MNCACHFLEVGRDPETGEHGWAGGFCLQTPVKSLDYKDTCSTYFGGISH